MRLFSEARHPHMSWITALLATLVVVLGGLVNAASAASPTPTSISLDSVSSANVAPTGTPGGAVPTVLVKAGERFTVRVSFYDSTGAPASFNTDTPLSVTSDRGTLTNVTAVAARGQTTATITASLPVAANQVGLTVAVATGKLARTVVPDSSEPAQLFDVVSQLRYEKSAAGFQQGIGGSSNCSEATSTAPVCGIVVLPDGAASSQVLLSIGACDATYALCGSPKGSVVQTLADLTGLYTKAAPATMVVKCDKTLCGGGAISDKHLNYSLLGNAALQQAPACPAKATVGADQPACVDYVQSKRDGSGDTYLYLLFTQDARVSVG